MLTFTMEQIECGSVEQRRAREKKNLSANPVHATNREQCFRTVATAIGRRRHDAQGI